MVTQPVERVTLSVRQTAQMLGLSINTVYALLYTGEIPSRRVGVKYLISKENVLKWLNRK